MNSIGEYLNHSDSYLDHLAQGNQQAADQSRGLADQSRNKFDHHYDIILKIRLDRQNLPDLDKKAIKQELKNASIGSKCKRFIPFWDQRATRVSKEIQQFNKTKNEIKSHQVLNDQAILEGGPYQNVGRLILRRLSSIDDFYRDARPKALDGWGTKDEEKEKGRKDWERDSKLINGELTFINEKLKSLRIDRNRQTDKLILVYDVRSLADLKELQNLLDTNSSSGGDQAQKIKKGIETIALDTYEAYSSISPFTKVKKVVGLADTVSKTWQTMTTESTQGYGTPSSNQFRWQQ